MDFNFFTWIREGVRQSVLLGVSDAVEQIGMPPENAELNERVANMMEGARKTPVAKSGGKSPRKRLGRTLKELDTTAEKK